MPASPTDLDDFELLAETLAEIVVRLAADGNYAYVSGRSREVLGYAPAELIGRSFFDLLHPDDVDRVRGAHATLPRDGGRVDLRYRHRHRDGGYVECEATARAGGGADALIVVDRAGRRDFESAFHAAPHGVAIVDLDGTFLRVNRKLTEIVGYSAAELTDLTFQEITHPDDLAADLAQADALLAGEADSYEMEKRYYTKDGRLIWVLLAVAIVREGGAPRRFISQVQDISARKRLEARTRELANRDPITSLYNRRRFEEELTRQIARCREEGESAALLLLDLDRFKTVNDSDGHVAGDRLIRTVGRTLDERVPEPDLAARIGGDEFAVILRDTDLAQARAVAEELRLAIAAVDTDRVCTASLGVCRLHGDVPDAETCFRAVDRAMYRAKGQGRDRVVVGSISERRP